MFSVHSQIYVRTAFLRVEARLPPRFEAAGLALEISATSGSARWVGQLRSVRHPSLWTDGHGHGAGVIDLLCVGSCLTELCVRLDDVTVGRLGREPRLDRRRQQLCDYVTRLGRMLEARDTTRAEVVEPARPSWVGRSSA